MNKTDEAYNRLRDAEREWYRLREAASDATKARNAQQRRVKKLRGEWLKLVEGK